MFATSLAACHAVPSPPLRCVSLPGGTDLVFGAPAEVPAASRHPHEGPRVGSVPPFEMAVCLVTNAEFCEFLNSESAAKWDAARLVVMRDFPQYEPCPVACHEGRWRYAQGAGEWACEQATWLGAFRFCQWLTATRNDGYVYSLPGEWEWEYAVRGTEGRIWPWGDDPPGPERGRRWQVIPWREARLRRGAPSGSFPAGATPEGIQDLIGTGRLHWCRDVYEAEPGRLVVPDDVGGEPDLGLLRAARGGAVQSIAPSNLMDALLSVTTREAMSWSRFACEPIRAAERQPFVFRWIRRGRD